MNHLAEDRKGSQIKKERGYQANSILQRWREAIASEKCYLQFTLGACLSSDLSGYTNFGIRSLMG